MNLLAMNRKKRNKRNKVSLCHLFKEIHNRKQTLQQKLNKWEMKRKYEKKKLVIHVLCRYWRLPIATLSIYYYNYYYININITCMNNGKLIYIYWE